MNRAVLINNVRVVITNGRHDSACPPPPKKKTKLPVMEVNRSQAYREYGALFSDAIYAAATNNHAWSFWKRTHYCDKCPCAINL